MNADYVNAVQADSISEIKGLSNLIIQTNKNAHEREPAGSQKQLIIIHTEPGNVDLLMSKQTHTLLFKTMNNVCLCVCVCVDW